MKPHIFIRADGSPEVGLGHIVRCMAIAHMLKMNFQITFICIKIPLSLQKEIKINGFSLNLICEEDDFFKLIYRDSIIVLDGYQFDTNYQKRIKSIGVKLVCIDDLHDKEFLADLIINHAPSVTPQDYKAQAYTQFALGLDYALLRPAFLEQAIKQRTIEVVETVLICFGGSDFKNLTHSSLQVALEFSKFTKIIVVTGAAYNIIESFRKLVTSDARIIHLHSLDEKQMIEIMLKADLAIVPSSSILFEVLATGCIAISGIYIDNQKLIYENFKNANLFVDAGNFLQDQLHKAISDVFDSDTQKMSFIDGDSGSRISRLFNNLWNEFLIKLRKVDIADVDLTFTWAANSEIRRYSFQQKQITKLEHTNWFFKKIMDPNCYYSIVEYENVAVGSVRFDINEGEAMISYFLDPLYHGQGFGEIVLKKGIEWFISASNKSSSLTHLISGEVMKSNIPSIKSFERMGFVKFDLEEKFKFEKYL